ncbi:family 16 glycosylhydrolase [Corynebacterium mendelii]|uniref:Family 16 glycosylhydrolase n=1 Tax=Corynebacterium mendelii TaxID=2765362 RepID=A0A939E176_9CORY|nr:family 16 glycosylhydrolase [Corynebacterium mendelii]MBN9643592.1 family 16 glycosylhydrolase [Corynebacterium mendelii]
MNKKFGKDLVTVLASVGVAASLSVAPASAGPLSNFSVHVPEVFDDWSVNFSPETDLSDWTLFDGFQDKQAGMFVFTRDALSLKDDHLLIRTRRHCVSTDDLNVEPLNDSNASVLPCPDGKITRYSTGRVYTPWLKGGAFTLEVEANMVVPEKGEEITVDGVKYSVPRNGARPAIWLQNGQAACHQKDASPYYGEIDLVEYYGHYPSNVNPSAIHWACNDNGKQRYRESRQLKADESLANAYHTWAVSTADEKIHFTVDGQHNHMVWGQPHEDWGLASMNQDEQTNKSDFHMVLNQPWRLILETEVETAKWAHPADPNAPFPDRFLKVRRVDLKYNNEKGQTVTVEVPVPTTTTETVKVPARVEVPVPTTTTTTVKEPVPTTTTETVKVPTRVEVPVPTTTTVRLPANAGRTTTKTVVSKQTVTVGRSSGNSNSSGSNEPTPLESSRDLVTVGTAAAGIVGLLSIVGAYLMYFPQFRGLVGGMPMFFNSLPRL